MDNEDISSGILQDMVQDMAQGSVEAVNKQVNNFLLEYFTSFQKFIKANGLEPFLSFGIILALTLSISIAVRSFFRRACRRAGKARNIFLRVLPGAMAVPAQMLIWLGATEIVFRTFKAIRTAVPFEEVDVAFAIGYIAVVTLALLRLNRRYFRAQREGIMRGDIVGIDMGSMDLLSKVLVVLTFIGAVLTALPVFGVSIGGLLAIGGVGGAIAGLAVKDTIANVFGSVMINIDQPFRVGDWIKLPAHNIEGTVEEIGWGQTTIRKFDKRPVYIPNSMLGNVLIENPGRMTHRRILEKVGIRYDDFNQLPAIIDSINDYLKSNLDLDQSQNPLARFVGYSAYSLDIEIAALTKKTAWLEFLQVHQGVLIEIGKLIAQHKAEIAFPTQVLQVANPAGAPQVFGQPPMDAAS